MIDVHETVDVSAPPEKVWAVLSDTHAVVGCVPGAELGAEHEDGTFDVSIGVKFGPIKVTFQASVVLELDAAAKQGKVSGRARDQGGTKVQATLTFSVTGQPAGSTVAMDGEVEISGRLASMIEGGATAVVKQMAREFAGRLAERCTA